MVTSLNRPAPNKVEPSNRNVRVAQLKIELREVRPRVWRRVLVPLSIRLPKLHVVLLRAMGWEGGHLHEFDFPVSRFGIPDPDWPDELVMDQSRVSLSQALGSDAAFTWTYDFGDRWVHAVKLERISTVPAALKLKHPLCLAGACTCPPENVGGAPGYELFLQAIADPGHPEHEDMMAWVGSPFDPLAFRVQEVQARLDEIAL
jgi:hypothetical protein